MSNVLLRQCDVNGKQLAYFNVWADWVFGGQLASVSASAAKVAMVIFAFAQSKTAVRLEIANHEMKHYTRLDEKTIKKAARELAEIGLLRIERGPLGIPAYVLLNPATGHRLPKPSDRSGVYRTTLRAPQPGKSLEASDAAENGDEFSGYGVPLKFD